MPHKKVKALEPVVKYMRVKYKDIFDMKGFYDALHEYLKEHEWMDVEDKLDHWETYYGERIDQSGAKEIWIQWRLFKEPRDAPFLNYYLDIDFHCLGLTSTEVVREGAKWKVNKGEVELVIKSFLEKKYESEFEGNFFLKEIKTIFSNRIYHTEIEQRKKQLYQETYALQNFIKQWFKLKRYLPYEEIKGFFPSYAWPSHMKQQ